MSSHSYVEAKAALLLDLATSFALKARIEQDAQRDPVDALSDAEALVWLNQLRLDEVFAAHARLRNDV